MTPDIARFRRRVTDLANYHGMTERELLAMLVEREDARITERGLRALEATPLWHAIGLRFD